MNAPTEDERLTAAAEAIASTIKAVANPLDLPLSVVREEIERRADTYARWQSYGLRLPADSWMLAVESVARDVTGRTRFVQKQREAAS